MTSQVKCKVKVTYKDGSGHDIEIEDKYLPIILDVIHRIEHLQDYGTAIMQTEKEIYE